MTEESNENQLQLTEETRARLKGLSKSLLRLHKTLLDDERAEYERVNGKVNSISEVFRLVLDDPHFAWLRKMSSMIALIDEFLASKTPTKETDGQAFIEEARVMLNFELSDDSFDDKFQNALQRNPNAVINHNDALKYVNTL